ncbi:MAG: sulfite exporter TauE/SafE family protein [Candidatus Eiseniibacteriota bacterium]|jgi:uncharacterized membrane protein YfcA
MAETATLSPVLAMLIGLVVAGVMSTGGLTGAFILLPFQVSVLGFVAPAVTPTNHLYNVIAIPAGVYRYAREGRMLWALAAILAAGTVPGVILGSLVRIHLLPDPRWFKLFVGLVLVLIGGQLLGRRRARGARRPAARHAQSMRVTMRRLDWRRLEYRYDGRDHGAPVVPLVLLTAVVGVIGGAYGIGGGALIAPLLITRWSLPVHTITGATLFATFLTSATGVLVFQLYGSVAGLEQVTPHWGTGLAFGAGGLVGTYTGAALQRHLPARAIETFLGCVITVLGVAYVVRALAGLAARG